MTYWATDLAADGPGVLYQEVLEQDERVMPSLGLIRDLTADVLVLSGIDYDHGRLVLGAIRDATGGGERFPYLFTTAPNSGVFTGLDLDGNRRLGQARDAQGYGRFPGQGGMAILSRWPLRLVADHSPRLWRNMPDSLLIDAQGRTGPQATGAQVQRLSSVVHWEVEVSPPNAAPLTLMIFHATPPVFDGPEDRNGRRNADEVRFWLHRLDGRFGPAPQPPFAIVGTFNLDPGAGEGRRQVMADVLTDPRLQDPAGLTGRPTAYWPEPGPGHLRVDYILPSHDLTVSGAKVMATDPQISSHHPILVDLDLPKIAAN